MGILGRGMLDKHQLFTQGHDYGVNAIFMSPLRNGPVGQTNLGVFGLGGLDSCGGICIWKGGLVSDHDDRRKFNTAQHWRWCGLHAHDDEAEQSHGDHGAHVQGKDFGSGACGHGELRVAMG